MRSLRSLCLFSLLAVSPFAPAQARLTEHTRKLDSGTVAKAKLDDVAWLEGRWVGEGFGGTLEETWAPPLGGAMVATFRLVKGDKPDFYEMCWIRERDGTLEYAVKHFHPDLKGWEEKDVHVAFPLVAIEKDAVYFQGLTLARDGDRCTHYLAMKQKDGTHREAALVYHRVGPTPLAATERDGSLDGLRALLGAWGPREAPKHVVHDYRWTVGEQAIRIREGFAVGHEPDAELDGTVFFSPQSGRIEFVAIAGKGKGQGRLFQGEYRVHDDGRIERTYTVWYRNLTDTPGEELGGLERRYREVYTIAGDSLKATLEWWRDGRWQPFGPGTYELVRRN